MPVSTSPRTHVVFVSVYVSRVGGASQAKAQLAQARKLPGSLCRRAVKRSLWSRTLEESGGLSLPVTGPMRVMERDIGRMSMSIHRPGWWCPAYFQKELLPIQMGVRKLKVYWPLVPVRVSALNIQIRTQHINRCSYRVDM
jgi:hypothetical protein